MEQGLERRKESLAVVREEEQNLVIIYPKLKAYWTCWAREMSKSVIRTMRLFMFF